jgi:hypothetical protein
LPGSQIRAKNYRAGVVVYVRKSMVKKTKGIKQPKNMYQALNITTKDLNEKRSIVQPVTWAIFILYIILLSFTMAHHELWGDELHSWNIAKGSNSFGDLIRNTRYEGHPPVWYTVLWIISKFTHDLGYVQLVHAIFAALTVFIVLFFSPFPFITRMLIPFGYYFLYEYAVLSRNYAIGVLLAFCICIIIHKTFKYRFLLYYILLFLMANTHLIALLLAVSVHMYFLLLQMEQKKGKSVLALHILAAGAIFLSSVYFISPPSDSELNVHFWMSRWNVHQIKAAGQLPLRAFIPVPIWWNDHFWNTQFLLDAQKKYTLLKFINSIILLMLLAAVFFVLKKNKKSLVFFIMNLSLSFVVTMAFFPLTTARHSGFIFIGFIVAYWLYCYKTPANQKHQWVVNTLLIIQIIASVFSVSKDIRLPFSNAYKVNELLNEVPGNEKTVTDFWALNIVSAFTGKPFYCVEMQKEMSFILLSDDMANMKKKSNRYYDGINNYFQREGIRKLYMISFRPPENLFKVDPKLSTSFQVKLIDKREGAIEYGDNLYLYQIKAY